MYIDTYITHATTTRVYYMHVCTYTHHICTHFICVYACTSITCVYIYVCVHVHIHAHLYKHGERCERIVPRCKLAMSIPT